MSIEPGFTKWVYYARPMSIYNTPEEFRDLEMLRTMGYTSVEFTDLMQERAKTEGMKPFEEKVVEADLLAFRAFPDGRIGAGVAREIAVAEDAGIPIIELPQLPSWRVLSLEDTRWYLRATGQR